MNLSFQYVPRRSLTLVISLIFMQAHLLSAQMVTGIWQGRIGNGWSGKKVEVKLVLKGDELTGTSYYYSSEKNYTRYTVKGYFHPENNTVIWWDDELIEEKRAGVSLSTSKGSVPILAEADFNCPGGGKMMLDGHSKEKGTEQQNGEIHLVKTERAIFDDEWVSLIRNFTSGGNDIGFIEETETMWKTTVRTEKQPDKAPVAETRPIAKKDKTTPTDSLVVLKQTEQKIIPPLPLMQPVLPDSIKTTRIFLERKKELSYEIPVTGDSVEIVFYDNAEIDGDSISLFLNDRILFEHIRLTEKPYSVRLSVNDLKKENELVMVAENLGSIPPNTAYMVAYVSGNRLSANLQSTEKSSAMIRLFKPDK